MRHRLTVPFSLSKELICCRVWWHFVVFALILQAFYFISASPTTESTKLNVAATQNSKAADNFLSPSSGSRVKELLFTDGKKIVEWRKRDEKNEGLLSTECFVYDKWTSNKSSGNENSSESVQKMQVSSQQMEEVIQLCLDTMKAERDLSAEESDQKKHLAKHKRFLIFPGTLWCGVGNKANQDRSRVGRFASTDTCCMIHDHCQPYILPRTTDSTTGLFNPNFIGTRFHCECDRAFRDCLKNSPDGLGSVIGQIYFNLGTQQCFEQGAGCTSTGWWIFKRKSCSTDAQAWRFVRSEY